jgi:outer membrane lipoprotein SlyB
MMRLSFQHITGAIIGGAVSGLFFYALGQHDGKQDAALKAAQAATHAIQSRAGINETVNNMDGYALCVELGGLRPDCEQLRGLAEDKP